MISNSLRWVAIVLAIVASTSGAVAGAADAPQTAPASPPPPPEPPARIAAASVVPALLKRGVAVIQFTAENVQLLPVYGDGALTAQPRLGHLHVTLDGLVWHWVHAGPDPIVLQGLPPGHHRVLLELANTNHHVIDARTVEIEIPAPP